MFASVGRAGLLVAGVAAAAVAVIAPDAVAGAPGQIDVQGGNGTVYSGGLYTIVYVSTTQVSSVSITDNGTALTVTGGLQNLYNARWTPTGAGTHVLQVTERDSAGNVAYSAQNTVTVQPDPIPAAAMTVSGGPTYTAGSTYTVGIDIGAVVGSNADIYVANPGGGGDDKLTVTPPADQTPASGTSTVATMQWTPKAPGTYQVYAVERISGYDEISVPPLTVVVTAAAGLPSTGSFGS